MSALTLQPDLSQAERFLTLLDESAESFTFQTFTDTPSGTPKPDPDLLAVVKHGTLAQHARWLTAMNRKGAGCFVCVNEADGKGRGHSNITRIRALWVEDDTGQAPPLPIEPHIIVESSLGKRHIYVLVDDMPIQDFDAAQARMVQDYGSDKAAQGINRVLRLPGFWHLKNRNSPHMVSIIHEAGTRPIPWAKLRSILPPVERQTQAPKDTEAVVTVTAGQVAELRSALNAISPDDYGTWIAMGHALVELGNVGRELWLSWSQQSGKWQPQDARRWDTFAGERTAYQAVFAEAQRQGWVNPKAKVDVPPIMPDTAPGTAGTSWLTPVAALLNTPSPMRWLIRNYLPPASLAMLVADPEAGKSLLALAWAASIALGRDWLGHRVQQGPVIYVAGEGHFGIRRRLKAWAIENEVEDDLRRAPLFISSSGTRLIDPAAFNAVIAEIDKATTPPALVVLDTMNRTSGMEENSADDAAVFFARLDSIRSRYGCAVLVTHHAGHSVKDRGRGTSALRAGMDTEYLLQVSNDVRTLTMSKGKDMPAPPPVSFILKQHYLPWVDADGCAETSVTLEPTQGGAHLPTRQASANVKLGVETFLAVLDNSQDASIGLEAWREAFYSKHTGDSLEAKKKGFQRVRADLVAGGVLSVRDDRYQVSELAGSCKWSDVSGMLFAHSIKVKPQR